MNKSLNKNYSKILNKINELTKSPNPDISAKALNVLQNKVLPLAERYQQIASVVDNRASVQKGYFEKEHSTVGVLGAVPTTTVFDEVAFREDLKSQTKTAKTNELRFDSKEVDELVELRRKHPEVDNLLNYKKGLLSQLRVDEIRFLVSYAEKKPELYNVVINNFDKLGLASATEMLESRVTDAKDIKFL